MKPSVLINIVLTLAVGVTGYALTMHFDSAAPREAAEQAVTAAPAPDFTFTDMHGTTHKLSDFRGRVVILNFWATWCAPCVVEFPALLDAAQRHGRDVVLIALSSDLEKKAVVKFLEKMSRQRGADRANDNVYVALDEGGKITQGLFGTIRLPETLIIGQDMTTRSKIIGASWRPEDLDKIIDGLKRDSPAAGNAIGSQP